MGGCYGAGRKLTGGRYDVHEPRLPLTGSQSLSFAILVEMSASDPAAMQDALTPIPLAICRNGSNIIYTEFRSIYNQSNLIKAVEIFNSMWHRSS